MLLSSPTNVSGVRQRTDRHTTDLVGIQQYRQRDLDIGVDIARVAAHHGNQTLYQVPELLGHGRVDTLWVGCMVLQHGIAVTFVPIDPIAYGIVRRRAIAVIGVRDRKCEPRREVGRV